MSSANRGGPKGDYRVIERDGVNVVQQRRRAAGRSRKYEWVDVWPRADEPDPRPPDAPHNAFQRARPRL